MVECFWREESIMPDWVRFGGQGFCTSALQLLYDLNLRVRKCESRSFDLFRTPHRCRRSMQMSSTFGSVCALLALDHRGLERRPPEPPDPYRAGWQGSLHH